MAQLNIGEKIREARRGKHMTQKKLADLVGCKSSFVSHIERNSRNMSLTYLGRIATALETHPYRLMTPGGDDQASHCVNLLDGLDTQHLNMAREYLEYLRERQKQREA